MMPSYLFRDYFVYLYTYIQVLHLVKPRLLILITQVCLKRSHSQRNVFRNHFHSMVYILPAHLHHDTTQSHDKLSLDSFQIPRFVDPCPSLTEHNATMHESEGFLTLYRTHLQSKVQYDQILLIRTPQHRYTLSHRPDSTLGWGR